jgi:hypothetical protein
MKSKFKDRVKNTVTPATEDIEVKKEKKKKRLALEEEDLEEHGKPGFSEEGQQSGFSEHGKPGFREHRAPGFSKRGKPCFREQGQSNTPESKGVLASESKGGLESREQGRLSSTENHFQAPTLESLGNHEENKRVRSEGSVIQHFINNADSITLNCNIPDSSTTDNLCQHVELYIFAF